jgi:hypothetical protein
MREFLELYEENNTHYYIYTAYQSTLASYYKSRQNNVAYLPSYGILRGSAIINQL